jgi:kynurenine formamidase
MSDSRRVAALAALLSALAAISSPQPPAVSPILDMKKLRVVDLSHTFDKTTLYWPTATSGFELRQVHVGKTPAGFFYSAYSFCAPEHGGTHLDAPIHFAEGRRAADEIPLEQLIAPAAVIDVTRQASADADYRLTIDDVRAWEKKHGTLPKGTIVLLRTGWGARWPDRKRYFGDETPGDASKLHFPAYGADAARLLVLERRVAALGVDTASLDHGPSQDFIVHQIANGADVPGLENVARLDEVPEWGAWVLALPLKIGGGSGGPVRIVALVPR